MLQFVKADVLRSDRKVIIEEIINYMLQSESKYIYESSIITVHHYTVKTQERTFVKDLIELVCGELNKIEDQDLSLINEEEKDNNLALVTKYTHFLHSLSNCKYTPILRI